MANGPVEPLEFSSGMRLIPLLAAELSHVTDLKGEVDDHFFSRMAVRVLFSTLDAYAFILKSIALSRLPISEGDLKPSVLKVLHEGYWDQDDSGSPLWKHSFPNPKHNLRVALRVFAFVCGTNTPLSGRAPLPNDFDSIVRLRNRVTHPKKPPDFEVNKTEVNQVVTTLAWTAQMVQWAKEQQVSLIEKDKAEVNALFDRLVSRARSFFTHEPLAPDRLHRGLTAPTSST